MPATTVMIYTHKHGTSVSLFTTKEIAYEEAALNIVEHYLNEIENPFIRATIAQLIAAKHYEAVVTAYNEAQNDRSDPDSINIYPDLDVTGEEDQPMATTTPNPAIGRIDELDPVERDLVVQMINHLASLPLEQRIELARSTIEKWYREPAAEPAAKCPKCGETDVEKFEITETFTAYHPVRGVKEGTLAIENALGTSCPSIHFDDGSSNYNVHCRGCMHHGSPTEFNLPADWDWV